MKNAMIKTLISVLFVLAALVPFQSGAQGDFQSVAGNRIHGSQTMSVTMVSGTEMEAGVVAFQVFWSTDLATYEPLADPFAATGVDGSVYAATYGCPLADGPLYIQVMATLGDATTVASDVVLVQEIVIVKHRPESQRPEKGFSR